MYIQRTRGSKTSTNEGRWLAPGVALAPRAPGSTLETKTAEAQGLDGSTTARDVSKVATDHHDPDPTTKKVGRNSPSTLGHPGAPTKSKTAEAQGLDIRAKVALSTASSDHDHDRKKKKRKKRKMAAPRPRPRRSGTREHAERKEGDKSADRGLRLNRSRQQGRSTAYTTLIQLRGLRRI